MEGAEKEAAPVIAARGIDPALSWVIVFRRLESIRRKARYQGLIGRQEIVRRSVVRMNDIMTMMDEFEEAGLIPAHVDYRGACDALRNDLMAEWMKLNKSRQGR